MPVVNFSPNQNAPAAASYSIPSVDFSTLGNLVNDYQTSKSNDLKNRAAQRADNQATAFKDGVPSMKDADGNDVKDSSGNALPDYSAMAKRLIQLGDTQTGVTLANTDLARQGMIAGQKAAANFGSGDVPGDSTSTPNYSYPAHGVPKPVSSSAPTDATGASGSAVAGIESGGRYDALGPVIDSGAYAGDRAYGKYQVMGKNIPGWTQEVLGRPMTPEQFVADPKAQDAVFKAKFGQLSDKYGQNGAARAWFAGEGGMNDPTRHDQLGTTVADYGRKFDSGMQVADASGRATPSGGGGIPPDGVPSGPVAAAPSAPAPAAPAAGVGPVGGPTAPVQTAAGPASSTPASGPQAEPVPAAPTPAATDPSLGGLVPPKWVQRFGAAAPGMYYRYAASIAAMPNIPAATKEAAAKIVEQVGGVMSKLQDPSTNMKDYGQYARTEMAAGRKPQPFATWMTQNVRGLETGDQKNARAMGKTISDAHAAIAGAEESAKTGPLVQRAGGVTAATEAAKAPYEMVPTQPVPGGPTVLVPKSDIAGSPGAPGQAGQPGAPVVAKQPEYIAKRQEELVGEEGKMVDAMHARQMVRERLNAISGVLQSLQTGAWGEEKGELVAKLRSLGLPIKDSDTANPAAVEQFMKNSIANVFGQAKELGGRILVTELEGLARANANPDLQPEANRAIVGQAQGLLNWEDKHTNDYFDWKRKNPDAYDKSQFELPWIKKEENSPGRFVGEATKSVAVKQAQLPPVDKLQDGQAYMTARGRAVWNAATKTFTPAPAAQ